jgi:hypothetical protein
VKHLNSIRAALRANGAAPVLAIPVPGHAPICVKAKLLKKALKGVTIDSVKVLPNRWLEVKGRAISKNNSYSSFPVHTCSKFAPIDRNKALLMIWDWSEKERKKRKKVSAMGVLSAKEQRALKLKQAEKAGIAELIQAQKEEVEILSEARESIFPVITPLDAEDRAEVIAEYSNFRKSLPNRKRGAVIRWKLDKLRKQVKEMTKVKCEYEERPAISPYARRRRTLKRKFVVLRKQGDKLKYAALLYQIGQLEKQFDSLYPRICKHYDFDGAQQYWVDSWITKRPKGQSYSIPWGWHDGCGTVEEVEDGYDCDWEEDYRSHVKNIPQIKKWAAQLKEARANIRALTPPADEQEELSQAA